MRGLFGALLAIVVVFTLGVPPIFTVEAHHGQPHAFRECIKAGGDLSFSEGWLTCRLTVTETERIYGLVTIDSGEMVQVEFETETQTTIVTYLFLPHRTTEITSSEWISCVTGTGEGTPAPCPPLS